MSGITSHTESRACKHGEVGCGQYYDCGRCAREKRARAYRNLTEEQKAYDRHVDPVGAYHTDFESGCSCHICAPCSFCTRDVVSDDLRAPRDPNYCSICTPAGIGYCRCEIASNE